MVTYLQVCQIILVSVIERLGNACLVPLLVLPHTNEAIQYNNYCSNDCSDCDDNERWYITRCVFSFEDERAYEIA
jgi:hypothetical protein